MKRYRLKDIQVDSGVLFVTIVPKRKKDLLRFKPGQYATIGFRGKNGKRSPMRCFSITSSPVRPEQLQFAIRLDGDFTTALSQLQIGTDIYLQGPFGDFVIDEQRDRRVVLLAGGIGITPFMSMIRTLPYTRGNVSITLLHSYRDGHSIPFYDELHGLRQKNPGLRVITFATDGATAPNEPRLFSGRMTEQHLRQVVGGEYAGSTYFICGPKGFTDSTIEMLINNGVSESRIITESFTQSSKVFTKSGRSIQRLTYGLVTAVLLIGIAGIAYLDLSRYVPRYTQTASKNQSTASASQTSNDDSQASTSSDTSTSSTATPKASDQNTSISSSGSSNNANQSYQQPTTSVS